MSLAYCMPWNNSISLTWQMFGYISWGEGIWQQLLSSETLEPETEVFSFSIVIVDSHPLWTLSSCFRDDVVMFCEGTAHTSMENKHYSFFFFSQLYFTPYHCVHPWMFLTLVLVLFFLSMKGSLLSLHSPKWWSHISKRWIYGASSSLHWCFTVRLCFVQLVKVDCFL